MLSIGVIAILTIAGVGVVSSIVDGTFMKYPERMNMSRQEISQIKALERALNERNNNE